MKLIQKRLKLYRLFEIDIWGLLICPESFSNKKIFSYFLSLKLRLIKETQLKNQRYIYRIDVKEPNPQKKRKNRKYVTRRIVRLFYLTLNYSNFRKLGKIAGKKEGSFESWYILFVEARLIFFLYRMNLIVNVFEIKKFLNLKKIWINSGIVTYPNYIIHPFDIVKIDKSILLETKYHIVQKLLNNLYYFNTPRYLFVNYNLLFALVFKYPQKKDISYPNKFVDLFRGLDYY